MQRFFLPGMMFCFLVGCAAPQENASSLSSVPERAGLESSVDRPEPTKLLAEVHGSRAKVRPEEDRSGDFWRLLADPGISTVHVFQGEGSHLLLGFEGGERVCVSLKAGEESALVLQDFSYRDPVVGLSPDASFALVRSSPPVLKRGREDVLILRGPEDIASSVWSPDGRDFLLAESNGTVHVWKGLPSVKAKGEERLHEYLRRQNADFRARFDSVAGPMALHRDGMLVLGGADGRVFRWSPGRGGAVEQLFHLDASLQSVSLGKTRVAVTSTKGQFFLISLVSGESESWAPEVRASWVSLSLEDERGLATFQDGVLSWRRMHSGKAVWERTVPSGEVCGLKTARGLVAICVGGVVGTYRVSDGEMTGSFALREGRLQGLGAFRQ